MTPRVLTVGRPSTSANAYTRTGVRCMLMVLNDESRAVVITVASLEMHAMQGCTELFANAQVGKALYTCHRWQYDKHLSAISRRAKIILTNKVQALTAI
eukprot:16089-Heterococcus_DN1.PRE.4